LRQKKEREQNKTKKARSVDQVVECLTSKYKNLSSNPRTGRRRRKRTKKEENSFSALVAMKNLDLRKTNTLFIHNHIISQNLEK
jgi:hypothetical protein